MEQDTSASKKTILKKRTFKERVKSICDMKSLTAEEKRQELRGFYAKYTADEKTLYKRYRKLKFETEQLGTLVLGTILGALSSVFIAAMGRPWSGIAEYVCWGVFVWLPAIGFVCWYLRVYMSKDVLLVYPVEMKLLEKELHIWDLPPSAQKSE